MQLSPIPAETAAPLTWSEMVVLARSNSQLAPSWIARLKAEAEALAEYHRQGVSSERRINLEIAAACRGYLDVQGYPEANDYLDDLDFLLNDEGEPELTAGYVERISPSVFGSYR